jgi:hypothetical protein
MHPGYAEAWCNRFLSNKAPIEEKQFIAKITQFNPSSRARETAQQSAIA